MARPGSSSKFVPVNLNSSYGKQHPSSIGGPSAGLGRSRSFGSSYGGMVSLNRPSRGPSSSVTAPKASKLTVPSPVNLPSLRREHSGNDPNVTLVGSSGPSGWTKQTVEDAGDTGASRSHGSKLDSSWGNNIVLHGKSPSGLDGSTQIAHGRLTSVHTLPVQKVVVFRGDDFPTLQSAAVPNSPSTPPQPRSKGFQQKQENESRSDPSNTQAVPYHQYTGDDLLYSKSSHERPAGPIGMPVRGSVSDQADSGSIERSGGDIRGPSPFIRLAHTSNWTDDERETLSSVQIQDRVKPDWSEPGGNWNGGRNVDSDFRRPSSRNGFHDRNGDSSSAFVSGFSKEKGSYPRGQFELDHGVDFDRPSGSMGRNELLKRGWSFSATEANARFGNSSYAADRERDTNGRIYGREVRDIRLETTGRDAFARDMRSGQNIYNVVEGKDSKFFLGKQGFPGGGLISPNHSGRGHGFLYGGSDNILPNKPHIIRQDMARVVEVKRERKGVAFFGRSHPDDPFLGDGISSSLYGSLPLDGKSSRMKKENFKDDLRDPARESFEAELERVQKMLEQERQRAVEERERALELARKEQEEQERLAREEEELRLKLEEEAREAAYRGKREAEEAARNAEEARRAREEEKRLAATEEERRKEAARRKLVELEERIAKRESLKRQEDALQQEEVSAVTSLVVDEVSSQSYDIRRNSEVSEDIHGKSRSSSGKLEHVHGDKGGSTSTLSLPSLSKGERGFSTGARLSTWKRERADYGPEVRSAEKGKVRHLQDDLPRSEPEYSERGPSFRNSSFRSRKEPVLGDMQDGASFENLDDVGERYCWGRDTPSNSQYGTYLDAAEYTSMGRLRQSLPKQPRVLPPPPGQAVTRKHSAQPDEPNHEMPSSSNGHFEAEPSSTEDLTNTTAGEAHHDAGDEDGRPTAVLVSQQFDSTPSEEVVLSDAGSQFSDDTLEDEAAPTIQTYPEQELHSDIVSETFTEEEVDEMFDMTEAQDSSEDNEPSRHVLEREGRLEKLEQSFKQEDGQGLRVRDGEEKRGPELANGEDKLEEEEDRELEGERNGSKEHENGCLMEDVASAIAEKGDGGVNRDSTPVEYVVGKQGEPCAEPAMELASEEGIQEQEVHHHHLQPAPVFSVSKGDAGQVRHMEGVSTRQSLVQHFQQSFSFMAMPLPPSNHVVAAPAMLPSVHGLSNQQELPFHVQLGLLPGVPLMPNAIQIGSIQMPLHIHPQMPQLSHVHGQQTPVFQFGQIGHAVSVTQPPPPTQPAAQLHHLVGQSLSSHKHQQPPDLISIADSGHASMDSNKQSKVGEVTSVADAMASLKVDVDKGVEVGAVPVAELDASVDQAGQKYLGEDKLEAASICNDGLADYNARPNNRSSHSNRRSNESRYHGNPGRGRGRFHTGQKYSHQAPHIVVESWVERSARGAAKGKVFRKSYRRAEYRVREPVLLESAADDMSPAPRPAMEESKGYRYVKKGAGGQSTAVSEKNGQVAGTRSRPAPNAGHSDQPSGRAVQPPPVQLQSTGGKEEQPVTGRGHQTTKPATATSASSRMKGLSRKYEGDTTKDAPCRTGVVRVFEQPGIETTCDKDDFIKVRSKRQLLRELREQREKESKIKPVDRVVREQSAKKQLRSSAKAGSAEGLAGTSSSKSSVRRRPAHTTERNATDCQNSTTNSSTGGLGGAMDGYDKTKNLPKPGRETSASKDVIMEFEDPTHDKHFREHSMTTAAWGGQRSNQEVVSLTQIQLEEAMKKPFGHNASFPESLHVPEKAMVTLGPGPSSSPSAAPAEKTVASTKGSSPLSSLLAGEKIQFGAVTSPTVFPSSNRPPPPMAVVQTGSPLGFRADSSHMTSHSTSYAGNYPESHIASTFTSKVVDSVSGDSFEGKVVDLEAEAEAAASAVAAAAINSDDSIEGKSNARGCADVSSKSSGLPETSPLSLQSQNMSSLDNPIAVALPADLSIETPPHLFQGSSMTLPDSSGVMLQSIQGGAPSYSGGPLLGGPVFSFGLNEDGLSSMEPGLPNWQQRHVGTPESFYGAPTFLNPPGLPNIQGHPHMLFYANPFASMGHFGQVGVSFMGAAYHPSGKQPDWTHVPLPSSSGPLATTSDGDLSAGAGGIMGTQHLNGASSSISTQRMQVTGSSSVLPITTPSCLFDTGLAAPFQVDGLLQSHWSKAPAPPVHNALSSGLAPPMQSMPSSRPAMDLNMQGHTSRVFANQPGHLRHLMGVNDGGFQQQLSVLKPPGAAQRPDELGVPDSMPIVSGLLNEARDGPLSEASLMSSLGSAGPALSKLQCPWSSQGHTNCGEFICGADSQNSDKRGGQASMGPHSKAVGQTASPTFKTSSSPYMEQRASKQTVVNGGELSRSSQRKAARVSTMENRGGSVTTSKLKQIYVAKAAGDSRKLGAACTRLNSLVA